jgi:hypothetical protein
MKFEKAARAVALKVLDSQDDCFLSGFIAIFGSSFIGSEVNEDCVEESLRWYASTHGVKCVSAGIENKPSELNEDCVGRQTQGDVGKNKETQPVAVFGQKPKAVGPLRKCEGCPALKKAEAGVYGLACGRDGGIVLLSYECRHGVAASAMDRQSIGVLRDVSVPVVDNANVCYGCINFARSDNSPASGLGICSKLGHPFDARWANGQSCYMYKERQ